VKTERVAEMVTRDFHYLLAAVACPAHSEADAWHGPRPNLKESAPKKIAIITRLCHEYVALKRSDLRHPRLRILEVEIQNLDTQLCFIKRPAELLVGIVQRYYRQNLDSVETGLALGVKPPAVRQTIWRLHRTWKRMRHHT